MFSDDQPELDPALADAVRRAYVRPVDEATAAEHVTAMAAAATGSTAPVTARTTGRRRGWRLGLAAGVATLALPVGLAAAGVALPDVVERPFDAVGIQLPNQPAGAPQGSPAPAVPVPRPITPLIPALPATPATPATGKPRTPAQSATGRPQSGRGRPNARKHVPKAPRKAAPPQSRRNAPGRAAPAKPVKPARPVTPVKPAKPVKPHVVPRRTVLPRSAPARPAGRANGRPRG